MEKTQRVRIVLEGTALLLGVSESISFGFFSKAKTVEMATTLKRLDPSHFNVKSTINNSEHEQHLESERCSCTSSMWPRTMCVYVKCLHHVKYAGFPPCCRPDLPLFTPLNSAKVKYWLVARGIMNSKGPGC